MSIFPVLDELHWTFLLVLPFCVGLVAYCWLGLDDAGAICLTTYMYMETRVG